MARLENRIVSLVALCTLALLTSCASNKGPGSLRDDPLRPGSVDEQRVKRLGVEQLYASAREALNSSDYTTALQLYDRLDAQYPFSAHATQGKLEAIYAHYRSFSPELALSAADRFIRANPRHQNLDYVLYLRGLVNFERGASDIMDMLDLDSSTRDPINARRAFEDFGRLVQRFPDSVYAADARQRMIYLRDRIARHEFAIARYYEKRRAWVGASRRAQDIIAKFQGSAVVPDALDMLARCYAALNLPEREAQIRAIRVASFPENTALLAPAKPDGEPVPPPAAPMAAPQDQTETQAMSETAPASEPQAADTAPASRPKSQARRPRQRR